MRLFDDPAERLRQQGRDLFGKSPQGGRQGGRRVRPALTVGATPRPAGQRAGRPKNGIVGAPDLGTASELLRWARQIDQTSNGAGSRYLQSIGMMPEVSTIGPVRANGQPYSNTSSGSPDTKFGRMPSPAGTPAPRAPTMNTGGPQQAQAQAGSSPNSQFGQNLQSSIMSLLNPAEDKRYGQQLRNRATEPIAAQTQRNLEESRMDAARRGAASSDADIRDQLNRVSAQGARDMSAASLDVDQALQELMNNKRIAGINAGNTLYGNQLNDQRARQELEMLLAQMQEENGPLAGLSAIFG